MIVQKIYGRNLSTLVRMGSVLTASCLVLGTVATAAPAHPQSTAPRTGGQPVSSPQNAASNFGTGLKGQATRAFWTAFRGGDYDALPGVIRLLTAASLRNPQDGNIALLLAHAHFWKIAERKRVSRPGPTITDQLILANSYFEMAHRLDPNDARILGWLGSGKISLGQVRRDPAMIRAGFAMLKEGVKRYPAFNHFTLAFMLSALPASDKRFQLGLEQMKLNQKICLGSGASQAGSKLTPYELASRSDPACVDSFEAPHNYEGFMLIYGDMLVKAGNPKAAKAVYERAKYAPAYDSWPFKGKLETNLQYAAKLIQGSASSKPPSGRVKQVFGSSYSCVVCHQASPTKP